MSRACCSFLCFCEIRLVEYSRAVSWPLLLGLVRVDSSIPDSTLGGRRRLLTDDCFRVSEAPIMVTARLSEHLNTCGNAGGVVRWCGSPAVVLHPPRICPRSVTTLSASLPVPTAKGYCCAAASVQCGVRKSEHLSHTLFFAEHGRPRLSDSWKKTRWCAEPTSDEPCAELTRRLVLASCFRTCTGHHSGT